MQVGMDFGSLLDRFLIDFGATLGAKLGPSWHQNLRKWCTKTMSKNHQKSGAARVRGGHAGGPQWSGVQAPKESLRDPLILEYKSTRGKLSALGTLPYRARGPGADIGGRHALLLPQHCHKMPPTSLKPAKAIGRVPTRCVRYIEQDDKGSSAIGRCIFACFWY